MTYDEAKTRHAALIFRLGNAQAALAAIPGLSSGPMGLTPENVRVTQPYKTAKAESVAAFEAFRDFNGPFCKTFAREIRADRDARRGRIPAQKAIGA